MFENPFDLSLFGMKIIESRRYPKMQLAPGDYVTPEFRKEIDAWLIEFFGYQDSIVPRNTVYTFGNNIIMRPEMAYMLRDISVS